MLIVDTDLGSIKVYRGETVYLPLKVYNGDGSEYTLPDWDGVDSSYDFSVLYPFIFSINYGDEVKNKGAYYHTANDKHILRVENNTIVFILGYNDTNKPEGDYTYQFVYKQWNESSHSFGGRTVYLIPPSLFQISSQDFFETPTP